MTKYLEELVAEQVRRYELAARLREGTDAPPPLRPVVTISRRKGSGASIVARKLADELGWSLWARELLDNIAKTARVSARVAEAFDERTVSELDLLLLDLFGEHEFAAFDYERQLARAILSIGKLGNAVIIGRGANFLLPDALNVLIDASDELRQHNLMTFERFDRATARARLEEWDKERQAFLKRMYGKKRVAAAGYDLNIRMGKLSIDGAAATIMAALADAFALPRR